MNRSKRNGSPRLARTLSAAILALVPLLVGLNAAPASAAACSGAVTTTRISGGEFDIDSGISPQLTGSYAGYKVTNSGAAIDDLWVKVTNFAGGVVSLAPNEDGLVHPGPLASGADAFAYVYLAASTTGTGQTHDVELYDGHPDFGGIQLCGDSFSLIVVETIKASANKVDTVVSGPNPAEIGGLVTMTVSGSTGTVGTGPPGHPDGANSFKANPATTPDWAADAYQLIDASIEFEFSGVYDDTLVVTGLGADEAYTATFWFQALGTTATPTAVSPVNFIASGTQIKHTDTGGFASLPPLLPPENHLTLSKSATPASLPDTGGAVEYSVVVSNDGTVEGNIDDFVDVLPAGAAYVSGSATYDGVTIDDPFITGDTLTFVDLFVVPVGGSATLGYQVTLPGIVGNYVNQASAHVGNTTIDASLAVDVDDPATVTVTVGDPADPPVVVDDETSTGAATATTIAVLDNDSDPDGNLDPSTLAVATQPTNGTVTVNSDGTITYTPDPGFSGNDSFTYEVCDTTALCATATVTVTVDAAPSPPVAVNDTASTPKSTPVKVMVLANDSDPDGDLSVASLTVKTAPVNGSAVVVNGGAITYTPDAGFFGSDPFTYTVCDMTGLCATGTVMVTVTNQAPTLGDDSATTKTGTAVSIDEMANDSDADGSLDGQSLSIVDAPVHGTAVINEDGTITYTPASGWTGTETFTYQICDDSGSCGLATVTVTTDGNDAPVYQGTPSIKAGPGGKLPPLTFTDPNGDPYTVTVVSGTLPPGVTLSPDGTWVGTASTAGTYTFTVRVCDSKTPPACTDTELTVVIEALAATGGQGPRVAMVGGLTLLFGAALVALARSDRRLMPVPVKRVSR